MSHDTLATRFVALSCSNITHQLVLGSPPPAVSNELCISKSETWMYHQANYLHSLVNMLVMYVLSHWRLSFLDSSRA